MQAHRSQRADFAALTSSDDGIGDAGDFGHFGHVVHANDMRASQNCGSHRRSHTPLTPLHRPGLFMAVSIACERPPEEGFSGCSDEQGAIEGRKLRQVRQQLKILFVAFAKSDPWIKNHLRSADASALGANERGTHAERHVAHNIRGKRPFLHRTRRATHVHQDNGHAGPAHHLRQRGIGAEGAHIVDDFYARANPRFRHRSFLGVERNWNAQFSAKTFEHRQHSRQLLFGADGIGSRTRRFPSEIENVGPSPLQLKCSSNRRLRVEIYAAIGKTVGGDVENPHQKRAFTKRQRA